MKEFITKGYSYSELNDEAKGKVKQWYLDAEWRNDVFSENTEAYLLEEFPNSDLKVFYSLGYCQGDGLNINGKLNMYDFLDKWEAEEKNKLKMEFVLDNIDHWYNFATNNHYCYSCKFIDRKQIEDDVQTTVDELQDAEITVTDDDYKIITEFYTDLVDYFEALDKKFEKSGYEYFYECTDEEVHEYCEANDYYFTEIGKFIG